MAINHATLAGTTGAKEKCYIGLDGFTAEYGTLTITITSTDTDKVTVSSATDEGADTRDGHLYASGDLHSFIATAASDDVGVDVVINVNVTATNLDRDLRYVISRARRN